MSNWISEFQHFSFETEAKVKLRPFVLCNFPLNQSHEWFKQQLSLAGQIRIANMVTPTEAVD